MNNRNLQRMHIVAILVACSILVGYWIYHHWIIATPFYMEADPEYAYMLSSLSVFKGQPYVFIEHPGTPMEIIGTIFHALSYPFTSGNLVQYHLMHTGQFILFFHFLLLIFNLITFYLIARYVIPIQHPTDIIASIAVASLFFAVHPWGFDMLAIWTHNAFNFPAGTLLVVTLFFLIRSEYPIKRWKIIVWSLCTGVLTATQVYFAVWVVGGIVTLGSLTYLQEKSFFRAFRLMFAVGALSVTGFFVSVLPVIPRFYIFRDWITKVASSQGYHGGGPAGITSVAQIQENLLTLIVQVPVFLVVSLPVFIIMMVVVWRQRHKLVQNMVLLAFTIGMFVQLILITALVFKSFRSIYMLAVAATLPAMLIITFSLLELRRLRVRQLYFTISLVIIFFFFGNAYRMGELRATNVHQVEAADARTAAYLDQYAIDNGLNRDSVRIVRTLSAPSLCHSLWYGNIYGNLAFDEELSEICPNEGFLYPWGMRFYVPDTWDTNTDFIIVASLYAINANPGLLTFGSKMVPYPDDGVVFIHP